MNGRRCIANRIGQVESMSREMDALFSERLRKYWKSPASAKDDRTAQEAENEPTASLELVRRAIRDRYAGDDLFVLTVILDKAESLLNRLQSQGADPGLADEIIPAVHEVLNRLEDLLGAFEARNGIRSKSR